MSIPEELATTEAILKLLGNAVGILSLRLSEDEWARKQGDRLGGKFTNEEFVAAIFQGALKLSVLIREEPS